MSDKLPKVKHNHTLTDILKASIFSLVMMAPVVAIGVTCAYVVFNKNAYQSYSGNTSLTYYERVQGSYPTNEVTSESDLVINNYYYINNLWTNDISYNGYLSIEFTPTTNVTFDDESNYSNPGESIKEPLKIVGIFEENYYYISYYLYNNQTIVINGNYASINGDVKLLNVDADGDSNFVSKFSSSSLTYDTYVENTIEQSTLDNVFYYAVDTMQNNSIFSWTKNTAIYTPINAMTTGLGVNTPAIAVLLTYWLLLTAIYVIIDIVIKGFTWMTHLIGER